MISFHILFSGILAITERLEGDNEGLCTLLGHLGLGMIYGHNDSN